MDNESLGGVKLTKVEDAINQIKRYYEQTPERIDDIEISFEYLIGSFFPDVLDNIKDRLKNEHTIGYIEGFNAGMSERDNNENT